MNLVNEPHILVCGTVRLSIGRETITVIAGNQLVEIIQHGEQHKKFEQGTIQNG